MADARPLLLLRYVGGDEVGLEFMADISAPPRAMDLRSRFGEPVFDEGVVGPVLSADGQWVAVLQEQGIVVRRVDGSQTHTIVLEDPARMYQMLCGFSPDSRALLYRTGQQEHVRWADHAPDPGYDLLTLSTMEHRRVKMVYGFSQWFPDSRRVLFTDGGKGELWLSQRDVDSDEGQILVNWGRSFGAPVVHDGLVYVRGSRLVLHKDPDREEYVDLTGEGAPGQFRDPTFSFDGTRVAYADGRAIRVISLADMTAATWMVCTGQCEFEWDSPTTLLVLDVGVLARASQAAPPAVTAKEGIAGFVVAGR